MSFQLQERDQGSRADAGVRPTLLYCDRHAGLAARRSHADLNRNRYASPNTQWNFHVHLHDTRRQTLRSACIRNVRGQAVHLGSHIQQRLRQRGASDQSIYARRIGLPFTCRKHAYEPSRRNTVLHRIRCVVDTIQNCALAAAVGHEDPRH